MKSGSQNKKRSGGDYAAQFIRTQNNKLRRAKKRKGRVDFWMGKGTRKNGQPVKGAIK